MGPEPRAKLIGSTDIALFPNGNPKITPDPSKVGHSQIRSWQNKVATAKAGLGAITAGPPPWRG